MKIRWLPGTEPVGVSADIGLDRGEDSEDGKEIVAFNSAWLGGVHDSDFHTSRRGDLRVQLFRVETWKRIIRLSRCQSKSPESGAWVRGPYSIMTR